MRSSIRKMGNSSGIIIPKRLLSEIGMKPGDDVELSVEGHRLVIDLARHSRAGWAEDAKRIAEAGDDFLILGEFPTDDDHTMNW